MSCPGRTAKFPKARLCFRYVSFETLVALVMLETLNVLGSLVPSVPVLGFDCKEMWQ